MLVTRSLVQRIGVVVRTAVIAGIGAIGTAASNGGDFPFRWL